MVVTGRQGDRVSELSGGRVQVEGASLRSGEVAVGWESGPSQSSPSEPCG